MLVVCQHLQEYKIRSALAWFWGVVFSLVLNTMKLYNAHQKEKKELEQKKDASAVAVVKRSLLLQYFKYVMNAIFAFTNCRIVPDLIISINSSELSDKFAHDGLLGVLGLVSALQAILTTWPGKK